MLTSRYPTTVYLSAPEMIRLIRRKGVSACIAGVADRIEREFLRWNEFDKSARVACHSDVGVIELMPIADAAQFAFKYVNGHPTNHLHGLPTVMAFGVLADVDTGAPRLLSELTLTTAIRTAAMSAVAARTLARRGSRSMALIGNGAQSEFQALSATWWASANCACSIPTRPRAPSWRPICWVRACRCASATARPKRCAAPTS
jgi:ornithine cyclodeaminase